jgi:hypothetical protein
LVVEVEGINPLVVLMVALEGVKGVVHIVRVLQLVVVFPLMQWAIMVVRVHVVLLVVQVEVGVLVF